MKHYSSQDWADFARDVVGREQQAGMQRHLETGCRKCAGNLGLWRRVHDIAQRQTAIQPPDNVVRTIKGMYSIYGFGKAPTGKVAIARLIFDSLQTPLPTGVRSTSAAPRQVLYGAGDHRIDLRFEPAIDSQKVSVMGQILDSTRPEQALGALLIALRKGRHQVLSESWTNQHGEFNFECPLEGGLQLRIKLPDKTEVVVPLSEPAEERIVSSSDLHDLSGVKRRPKKNKDSGRKD